MALLKYLEVAVVQAATDEEYTVLTRVTCLTEPYTHVISAGAQQLFAVGPINTGIESIESHRSTSAADNFLQQIGADELF